jgi:hypothetical protein
MVGAHLRQHGDTKGLLRDKWPAPCDQLKGASISGEARARVGYTSNCLPSEIIGLD